jgi:hypothetical protein
VNFNYPLLVAVCVLWLSPAFAPWGRWFWASIAAFILAELGLCVAIMLELGNPTLDDSPGLILLPLLPGIPAVLFMVVILIRLTLRFVRRLSR